MSAQGDAGHRWATSGENLKGLKLGKPGFVATQVGDALKHIAKPLKKAGDKADLEERRQAAKADADARFKERTDYKATKTIEVEKAKQDTIAARAAAVEATNRSRQEHPVKMAQARVAAAAVRGAAKKPVAAKKPATAKAPAAKPVATKAPAAKTTTPKVVAPKVAGTPRKRTQSPSVRKEFTSPVGDAPIVKNKKSKSPVAGYDFGNSFENIGGIKPAQASED